MKKFLRGYKKIVILGIGNEIKGDDALGAIIAQKSLLLFDKNENIVVFDGGTVPENYTGLIRKENPTHIILVDAVDMKKEPGHIRVVEKEEIANYNISTHAMPISFLIKYMETTLSAQIILLGIQPKSMGFAEPISKEVEESIGEVLITFDKVIKENFN
ncbi:MULTISPECIES: hydrogenase maturation peptidase HycI [Methanobacterium]|uniref:Hydrogenase maturation peptidase HycI n=1 Tax=Methanobacterium veterum TaxID=408577 RepID=A0A9E4ZYR0_9EURY|nr:MULTISPECIES: hydrogenase maturation peptidase HycI [Methanobacterium]MCZ3366782.1 hydrogenase maturation peptidase HycI [Methanobacterium veterum]MCZ3374071.1 hydrogenase maturation peptidase HycI [Methanobacterium veterum]